MLKKLNFDDTHNIMDITLGSHLAGEIGFTEDKFIGYLHVEHKDIYYCSEYLKDVKDAIYLFNEIESLGFKVIVETSPLNPNKELELACINRGMNAVKGEDGLIERFYSK